MTSSAAAWCVLLLAVAAANLPFMNERLFMIGPHQGTKSLSWRLIELMVFSGLALWVGLAFEAYLGQAQKQSWGFYAAFGFLSLTFAFPGFVWRYLRRRVQ